MSPNNARWNGRAIRAVILDFGEVLSHPPAPETIAFLAELFHLTPEKFREFYYAERYRYDRGQLAAEDYWRAIAKDAGVPLSPEQIELLRRTDVEMWSNVNPAMLQWAADLRASGLLTAVLSNMHLDMAKVVRSTSTWIEDFDCFVLSAELGMAKPDPEIFQRCLECLQIAPGEAIFIDDKQRNTQAAETLGMATLCADSASGIREQLMAGGWTAPLPAG
jgi:putative hydrolase of the HAD superfamily